MKNNNYTQADLEVLIQRYFDGLTSLDEERRLRAMIAQCDYDSPAIDEARAVMGFFAARKRAAVKPRRFSRRLRVVAAAAIAVVVAGALLVSLGWHGNESSVLPTRYEAYCGDRVITDRDEVSALAQVQLGAVLEASRQINNSVRGELQSLSSMLDNAELQ